MKHNEKTVTFNQIEKMGVCQEMLEWLMRKNWVISGLSANMEGVLMWYSVPLNISKLYTLVCKENPQWAEWMREHFTDEALGIVPPKEEFCECSWSKFHIINKNIIPYGKIWRNVSTYEEITYCCQCGKKLAPPKPPEQTFKGKQSEYPNTIYPIGTKVKMHRDSNDKFCKSNCLLEKVGGREGVIVENISQGDNDYWQHYMIEIDGKRSGCFDHTQFTVLPDPPKEDFCGCDTFKRSISAGFVVNEKLAGDVHWRFKDGIIGFRWIVFCWDCGKKLAPPKPPEQTLKVGDTIRTTKGEIFLFGDEWLSLYCKWNNKVFRSRQIVMSDGSLCAGDLLRNLTESWDLGKFIEKVEKE